MREILFRGKTTSGKWVEGYVVKGANTYIIPLNNVKGIVVSVCGNLGVFADKVIPETVGQYTGLTDKNGKKIFEGDIIKQEYSIGRIISVVEYGISYGLYDACGVYQRFRDGSGTAMLSVGTNNGVVWCEVIGNIHDNPELLKGE